MTNPVTPPASTISAQAPDDATLTWSSLQRAELLPAQVTNKQGDFADNSVTVVENSIARNKKKYTKAPPDEVVTPDEQVATKATTDQTETDALKVTCTEEDAEG